MKKTLVIGASLKEERYSNMAIKLLRKYNIDVVAIGLRSGIVSDIEINTNKLNFKDIHTITMYINPQRQKPFFDYIISLNPKRVIFNPGTENIEFINILNLKGIETVTNCTLVMLNTNLF